jgi:2-polyprenyl-6-methoxyphenol hydroxylase-like FAD-dependent oxidoreductase
MADILVLGAGLNGLCAALLLARDGHRVTVVERDAADPPDPGAAWEGWDRRGCAQFRLPHYLLPRFRQVLDEVLPDVAEALAAAGAARYDVVDALPEQATGGRRPGDDRFAALTARRPVLEAVLAARAAAEPGVVVRRGCAVRSLLAGPAAEPGVPHVRGAVTATGERLVADLVVDATGRRSPVASWVAALGAAPLPAERAPSGLAYYARHFRADAPPPLRGPLHQQYDSLSVLTLPADNGTWAVVLCVAAQDRPLRALRDAERWTAVARSYPLAVPWTDAEPLTGVVAMSGLEDRRTTTAVDGRPVVTGLLLLGDSWASTDPSLGRGTSIGLLHVRLLRDVLRDVGPDEPGELARRFDAETHRVVEPWYRGTVATGRQRLAELTADREGAEPAPDPRAAVAVQLRAAAGRDPDALRAALDLASMLEQPAEVFARPGLLARVAAAADGAPRYVLPGPARGGLLAAVEG